MAEAERLKRQIKALCEEVGAVMLRLRRAAVREHHMQAQPPNAEALWLVQKQKQMHVANFNRLHSKIVTLYLQLRKYDHELHMSTAFNWVIGYPEEIIFTPPLN